MAQQALGVRGAWGQMSSLEVPRLIQAGVEVQQVWMGHTCVGAKTRGLHCTGCALRCKGCLQSAKATWVCACIAAQQQPYFNPPPPTTR